MTTIDTMPLRALAVLDAVARLESFSEAGRHLGLPRAAISRTIAQLETRLGTNLFRRTTRKVALTEAGEVLVAQIGPALRQIQSAITTASDESGQIAGRITLSVSHSFGRHFVLPALSGFAALHPDIEIDVNLADVIDDLVDNEIDLTIRVGALPNSSLICRKLGRFDIVLAAARELLDRNGNPSDFDRVRRLPAINFRIPGTQQLLPWPIQRDGARRNHVPENAVLTCNSVEAVVDLVRQGRGVAPVPRYLVRDDLRSGHLVSLLEQEVDWDADVHLCFSTHRLEPKRVRLLIDHLATEIRARLAREREGRPKSAACLNTHRGRATA